MECTVLIMEHKGVSAWVAQGLEYNICVQGDSPKGAIENFCRLAYCEHLLAKHLGKNLRDCVPEAPQHIQDIYSRKKATELPQISCEDIAGAGTSERVFKLNPRLVL